MSSPEARKATEPSAGSGRARRGLRLALATLGAAALLAGCGAGFKPLYGDASLGGAGFNEKLAQLDVAPIPGRVGQRIRNELIFQATGGGAQAPPEYRLEIAITQSISSNLVEKDGEAQARTFNLDAAFRIVRLSDKSVMLEGVSYGRAVYQEFDSVFANVRAKNDAENRAAQTVAVDLKSRLSAFLANAA